MTSEVDVATLLSGRKQRHLFLRGVAEVIDLLVIGLVFVALNVLMPDLGPGLHLCFLVLYFTIAEAAFGRTLGKVIFGLRVVGPDGRTSSAFQCLVRNVIRPFEAFGVVALIVADTSNRGQRIGDLAAHTFVVRTNELEDLAFDKEELSSNNASTSRQVVSISPSALELARSGIAASTRPAHTGLTVVERPGDRNALAVQFDLLEQDDSMWQWTTDGVTISVPKELAARCGNLLIDAQDGKLVVAQTSA